MKKILCILLMLSMCVGLFTACSNSDPNVKKTTAVSNEDYEVDTNEDVSNSESTDSDSAVDVKYYANRSYELHFLLAVDSFDNPSQISTNALVQYAFCRLYYDNLVDMPKSGVKMREATKKQIEDQIQKEFGKVDIDVTKSDLYNQGKKKFEMWEPLYGSDIYFDAKAQEVNKNEYTVTSTFYNDEAKSEVKGTTTITIELDKNGNQYITKLSSK